MTRDQAPSRLRRRILQGSAALAWMPLSGLAVAKGDNTGDDTSIDASANTGVGIVALSALEANGGGRLGLCLCDAQGKTLLQYRAGERFPFCSTFKMMLAAAILQRSVNDATLLAQRLHYPQSAVLSYAPVTKQHVADGMRIDELCAAAIGYSDNTAANLLLEIIGGPQALTAFAHSKGDKDFTLNRNEPGLNSAIPDDLRDTTTPGAMARSLQYMTLGDGLPATQRALLNTWLRNCQTGGKRIHATLPGDWQAGDKTGSGDYGTTNDIAILYPPAKPPLIMAVYFTQKEPAATLREDVVAKAARIALTLSGHLS